MTKNIDLARNTLNILLRMKKIHIQDYTKSELLENFDLIKELSDEKVTLVNITKGHEYPLMSSIYDCYRYMVNQDIKFNVTKISIYERWVEEDLKEMPSLDGTCFELLK